MLFARPSSASSTIAPESPAFSASTASPISSPPGASSTCVAANFARDQSRKVSPRFSEATESPPPRSNPGNSRSAKPVFARCLLDIKERLRLFSKSSQSSAFSRHSFHPHGRIVQRERLDRSHRTTFSTQAPRASVPRGGLGTRRDLALLAANATAPPPHSLWPLLAASDRHVAMPFFTLVAAAVFFQILFGFFRALSGVVEQATLCPSFRATLWAAPNPPSPSSPLSFKSFELRARLGLSKIFVKRWLLPSRTFLTSAAPCPLFAPTPHPRESTLNA